MTNTQAEPQWWIRAQFGISVNGCDPDELEATFDTLSEALDAADLTRERVVVRMVSPWTD